MFECVAGPDLGPALSAVELAGLDGEGLVEALAATQRLVSWAQARQAELVAEVARRVPEVIGPGGCSGYEVAEFEVGAALRLSSRAAQARVEGCLAIAERPAVLEALRSGRLDWVRAVAVASAVGALALRPGMAQAADAVERAALERAPGQTAPQLRARLARLVQQADPAAADARHAEARKERYVWVDPREDGMAELRALLTAPDALRVYAALGEAAWAARQAEAAPAGERRTLDQLRADALVRIACAGTVSESGGRGAGPAGAGVAVRPGGARPPGAPTETSATGPVPRRERPQILVTVPAGTLLGLGGEPAHLAGYGPIPDSLARELAQDGVWRRVLTDPASGAVLDVGRTQHDPPADLERFIRVRDGMCRFPGCRRQASGCDLDHLVPYPHGPTSAENLHALCRRHHRLKHETGWQAIARPGGRLEWTSPLGAVHTTSPPDPGGEAWTQTGRGTASERLRAWVIDARHRSPFEVALELAG